MKNKLPYLSAVEKHSLEVEPANLAGARHPGTLRLTGTHIGCDTTSCGACTILLNGKSIVKSCTVLAIQWQRISTVEGIYYRRNCIPFRKALKENHTALRLCTPGMLMRAKELLEHNPEPTEEEIRWGISGNLCRCTGYNNIVKAASPKCRAENASRNLSLCRRGVRYSRPQTAN